MKIKPGPSFKDWKAAWLASLDAGDQFQTRRPVDTALGTRWSLEYVEGRGWGIQEWTADGLPRIVCYANYQPGQVYYMREWLQKCKSQLGLPFAVYSSDGDFVYPDRSSGHGLDWEWQGDKLQAIFMPRRAARTFARCVDVRVERFGEISDEDAICEGAKAHPTWGQKKGNLHCSWTPRKHFNEVVIPEIYDDPPEWWFAYTFEKVEGDNES